VNAYTYYNPVPGAIWNSRDQLELIKLWEKSWRKHGWNPVVLSEAHAKKHPRFPEFKQIFWSLPTEYGHDYEGQCFMRYAAVSIQKQPMSLMLDYDVINYGFTPEDALVATRKYLDPRLIFFSAEGRHHCGMTLGPWELFEGYAAICASWKPSQADWNDSATYHGFHCSDNSLLVGMFNGSHQRPAWLVMDDSGPNWVWPRTQWAESKAVHYGFEMNHAGNWPKWKHIERLRPI
jgi:hypothetical protein